MTDNIHKVSRAARPTRAVGTSSGYTPTGTITTGGTVTTTNTGPNTSTVSGSGLNFAVGTSGHLFSSNLGATGYFIAIKTTQSMSPVLPPMVIETCDEQQKTVKMTLKPESGISAADLNKIMMLCMAYVNAPHEFNALAYVKLHNLEKHFTYA